MIDTERPSLTLAILTWRHARFVTSCLTSILEADFGDHDVQIVVLDNGSNDGTAAIVESFLSDNGLSWEFIRSPRNLGSREALNVLLAKATGDCFSWISGDDYIHRDRYLLQLRAFQEGGSSLVIVSGAAVEVDEAGAVIPGRDPLVLSQIEETLDLREVVLSRNDGPHVVTQTLSTCALRSIGGWDPEIPFNDTQIDFRLALIPGSTVRVVPSAITFYRVHSGMSSSYLNSHAFVGLFDYFLSHEELSAGERSTVESWRDRSISHAHYERCLVDFGEGSPQSRRNLFTAAFLPRLQLRSRLNCFLLSLSPLQTRRRCRARYAIYEPPYAAEGPSEAGEV